MLTYALRKGLLTVPILLGVCLLAFLIVHMTPGNPAQIMAGPQASKEDIRNLEKKLGLDQPLHVQFWRFLSNAVTGDLGRSIRTGRPIVNELKNRLPFTLQLAGGALFVSVLVGIPTGVVSAVRQNSWFDATSMTVALFGLSMPSFWRGLMLMLLFAFYLGWFPAGGASMELFTLDWLRYLVLPAVSLGIASAATIARLTRSSMLEVIREDYIRTARSKGLAERVVTFKHALKNALIPVVTVVGLQLGFLLGGAVVTESVFAYPGVGTLVVQGITSRDYPMVQGIVMVVAFVFVMVNLLVDLLYGFLDPRIRYD